MAKVLVKIELKQKQHKHKRNRKENIYNFTFTTAPTTDFYGCPVQHTQQTNLEKIENQTDCILFCFQTM